MKFIRTTAMLLTCSATAALMTAPQAAAQDDAAFSLSANAALVSDYRFRGISLSDKDIALQGGFDIGTESGFYVGTWGSSIEQYPASDPVAGIEGSELELDIYGGYATTVGGLDLDVGLLAYTYPGSEGTTYWEPYASIGGSVGNISWTLGANYAWSQASLGDADNLYIHFETGVEIPDTGVALSGHIALEDGALDAALPGNSKLDWSLGAEYAFESYSIGVAYVDTNVAAGDAGIVISLSSSF